VRTYNFKGSGSDITKLYQATCNEAGVKTWTQILEGLPLQNCPKLGKIFDFDHKYLGNEHNENLKNT